MAKRGVELVAVNHGLPATSAAMAMLVEHVSQRESEEIATHLRLLPHASSSFWKQTQVFGKLYMQHQEAVEEQCIRAVKVAEKTAGIVLSIDRVSLPMEYPRKRAAGRSKHNAPKRPIQGVFEMAYCATMSWHDAQGKTLGTIRWHCSYERPRDLTPSRWTRCSRVSRLSTNVARGTAGVTRVRIEHSG